MPFSNWTASLINEIYSIQRDRKLIIVVAYIDRYLNKKIIGFIKDMLNFGVLFQINASAFFDRKRRNDALVMLKNREIHFIASDCHNMTVRPPRLREAYDVIEHIKMADLILKYRQKMLATPTHYYTLSNRTICAVSYSLKARIVRLRSKLQSAVISLSQRFYLFYIRLSADQKHGKIIDVSSRRAREKQTADRL